MLHAEWAYLNRPDRLARWWLGLDRTWASPADPRTVRRGDQVAYPPEPEPAEPAEAADPDADPAGETE